MKFSELSARSVVNLYAGDLQGMPEYRTRQQLGLPLTQEDKWHFTKPLPLTDESVDTYQSEDVFEHITYETIPAIISKINRYSKKVDFSGYHSPIIAAMFSTSDRSKTAREISYLTRSAVVRTNAGLRSLARRS